MKGSQNEKNAITLSLHSRTETPCKHRSIFIIRVIVRNCVYHIPLISSPAVRPSDPPLL